MQGPIHLGVALAPDEVLIPSPSDHGIRVGRKLAQVIILTAKFARTRVRRSLDAVGKSTGAAKTGSTHIRQHPDFVWPKTTTPVYRNRGAATEASTLQPVTIGKELATNQASATERVAK